MSLEPDFPFLSVVLTADTQAVGEHLQKGVISMTFQALVLLGNAHNSCDGVGSPAPSHCGELPGNPSEICCTCREGTASPRHARPEAQGGLTSQTPRP